MYSSKAQEKYYQTKRVYVTKELVTSRWNRKGYYRWAVVTFDTATREITNELDNLTKAQAIDAAKARAEANNLPFDLQADIVESAELTRGPELECVGCGGKWPDHYWGVYKRGLKPALCPKCQEAHIAGMAVLEDKVRTLWPNDDGISKFGDDMRRLLSTLMQAGYPERSAGARGYYWVISKSQAGALEEFLNLVHDIQKAAYDRGHYNGSSILHQLARGEVNANDFADIREEHVNRSSA